MSTELTTPGGLSQTMDQGIGVSVSKRVTQMTLDMAKAITPSSPAATALIAAEMGGRSASN